MAESLPQKMKFVDQTGPGGPEVLRMGETQIPKPGDYEVLIEVQAAGVNRPDLAQRAGKYPPPQGASPIMGLEVAGVIVARGEKSTAIIGEKVCALTAGGGYAQYCLVHESNCLPVPQGLSMLDAAGIPETFFTVWANVFQIGGLKSNERILIHGGSSGIGTTALQLARANGAEVFITAGTDEKCEACLKLGAHHAINYKTKSFDQEVARLTDGKGLNLILDMVAGDYTPRNLECLAPQGRLVQIATQKGAEVTINIMKVMQKRLTITGSTMRPRSLEDKAQIARELREKVWPLFESKKIHVIVDQVFRLDHIRQAHEYLEKGDHVGKVILEVK
jgi:NADPH2:quinone reductase